MPLFQWRAIASRLYIRKRQVRRNREEEGGWGGLQFVSRILQKRYKKRRGRGGNEGWPPPNPGDTNGISLSGSPPKRHHRPCMRDQRNRANTKLDKILEITFYSIFFPKVWNSERNVIFAMYFLPIRWIRSSLSFRR